MNDFIAIGNSDIKLPILERKYIDCDKHGSQIEATIKGNCKQCLDDIVNQEREAEILVRYRKRQSEAGVGLMYQDACLDEAMTHQSKAAKQLKDYQLKQNIAMFGNTGTGKTWLACALLNKLLMSGKNGYFIKFYNLMDIKIRNPIKFDKILNCDMLVIDEFGVFDTDTKGSMLHQIYDHRVENGLPSMLITNLHPQKAKESMPDALYSRIVYNCIVMQLTGNDLRISKE